MSTVAPPEGTEAITPRHARFPLVDAVRALADCGLPQHGRIGLTIVPDEETGGQRGSRYLSEQGLLGQGAIGMILPEPTTGALIWNANRGAITLRVTVRGRHAHVGQHYRGINAFEGMVTAANALLALKGEVEEHRTRYRLDSEPDPVAASRSILMLGGLVAGGDDEVRLCSCSSLQTAPFNLGRDEKGRYRFTLNFALHVRALTEHRD